MQLQVLGTPQRHAGLHSARPDFLVSVNKASAAELAEASGLPRTPALLANAYVDLLKWLHEQAWFNEYDGTEPEDPEERAIWNCRAALVDVFAYDQREDP